MRLDICSHSTCPFISPPGLAADECSTWFGPDACAVLGCSGWMVSLTLVCIGYQSIDNDIQPCLWVCLKPSEAGSVTWLLCHVYIYKFSNMCLRKINGRGPQILVPMDRSLEQDHS